ncbi:MAG: hypothetical protein JWN30_2002, partial [Bacilli bacterium]|nr:hypothetical protein [Bacilli bacterium]
KNVQLLAGNKDVAKCRQFEYKRKFTNEMTGAQCLGPFTHGSSINWKVIEGCPYSSEQLMSCVSFFRVNLC